MMRRPVTLAVALLALSCPLAHAGSKPRPIAASSVQVFTKKHAVKAWELLPLTTIAGYLSSIAGRPIAISCDEPGVPGPDGHTLEPGNDGNVFWNGTEYGPFVHVSTAECLEAQRVTRKRDANPVSWFEFQGRRIDDISGPALEVMLHETMHIALQSADEGLVECTAVSNAWALVRQVGLPAKAAQQTLDGMRWRSSVFPAQYHTTPSC